MGVSTQQTSFPYRHSLFKLTSFPYRRSLFNFDAPCRCQRQITLVCVEGTELPPIQKCTECCSRYHCPLCNSNIFKPTDRYRVIIHLKAHLATSVKYKDAKKCFGEGLSRGDPLRRRCRLPYPVINMYSLEGCGVVNVKKLPQAVRDMCVPFKIVQCRNCRCVFSKTGWGTVETEDMETCEGFIQTLNFLSIAQTASFRGQE
ncbi:uncharacterized protein LOC122142825 [Cyprinus carpio]|uniref:Uncharacterized protein LOC122142825 n=1 Tax=Cyprinus carpio TaxID=7962 RepID=A0A9R0ASN6_CYPCA|nr:uncharacterized protein LOC122142825 [Cyprinus carpio]